MSDPTRASGQSDCEEVLAAWQSAYDGWEAVLAAAIRDNDRAEIDRALKAMELARTKIQIYRKRLMN